MIAMGRIPPPGGSHRLRRLGRPSRTGTSNGHRHPTHSFTLSLLPLRTSGNGGLTISQVHYSHNDGAVSARCCCCLLELGLSDRAAASGTGCAASAPSQGRDGPLLRWLPALAPQASTADNFAFPPLAEPLCRSVPPSLIQRAGMGNGNTPARATSRARPGPWRCSQAPDPLRFSPVVRLDQIGTVRPIYRAT